MVNRKANNYYLFTEARIHLLPQRYRRQYVWQLIYGGKPAFIIKLLSSERDVRYYVFSLQRDNAAVYEIKIALIQIHRIILVRALIGRRY